MGAIRQEVVLQKFAKSGDSLIVKRSVRKLKSESKININHEGREGKQWYKYTLSLNSALDWVGG